MARGGKRKTLANVTATSKAKRQKRSSSAAAPAAVVPAASARESRSGRTVKLLTRYT
jgi:hypothetical protein